MAVENGGLLVVGPLLDTWTGMMDQIKIWVGGLFGLSLLFFLIKFYGDHQEKKMIRTVQREVLNIQQRLDMMNVPRPPPQERQTLRKKLAEKLHHPKLLKKKRV